MAKMTFTDLESLLARNQWGATGALNSSISHERAKLFQRYMGEPYGDEVEDQSQIVMTDIRDTVEGIKPELMDIFFGSDKVASFSPRGEEDVDGAEQETEVVNYIINQQNNGFMVFYKWFHDALVYKNGYVKRYWDDREHSYIEEHDDLSQDEAASILLDIQAKDAEVEVVEQWSDEGETPDGDEGGEPVSIGFKLKVTEKNTRYIVESIPPDEIHVSPQWTQLDFKECPFVAHRRAMPVSDLLEMGFDRKQVERLNTHDSRLDNEEVNVRFSGDRFQETDLQNTPDASMRLVLVYENYIRADLDGDGIAELLQVYTGGENGEILKRGGKRAIEEVDAAPFNVACPMPVPHKHYGMSVAELVQDLQRLRTVLVRQMVNNLVKSNNPDRVIDQDAMTDDTYADLQSASAGGRDIRIPGGVGVQQLPVANTASQSLMGIEYVDALRESRTGVTRYNQGLDANSLNKTASGVHQIMSAAQKKILLIARVFAETGVKQLFLDMHRDLRKGPMKKIAIQLRNKWVEVNPRTWRDRTDMTVSVGLGTGNRDVQFQRLGLILQQQKEGLAAGLVKPENIYHTLKKMTEISGFKDVTAFFPDPKTLQPQQPPPPPLDPSIELAKIEHEKIKMQMQTKMAELEIKRAELQLKAQSEQTRRLDVMMKDDRERDLAGAKIEADEAARMQQSIDGMGLTHNG